MQGQVLLCQRAKETSAVNPSGNDGNVTTITFPLRTGLHVRTLHASCADLNGGKLSRPASLYTFFSQQGIAGVPGGSVIN